MSNIYIGYHFTVEPKRYEDSELAKQLGSEILIAELEKLLLKVLLKQKFLLCSKGLMGRNNLGEHPNITI
jgi:hypothetical protein